MAKAFVSYSRKDIEFAKRLTGELQKSEMDFWVDWEGIPPTVDWWEKIENGIEEADVFLFLISPDSAKSKVCGQEIETAVKNGKRLIPLVVREIAWGETPPHLGHLNYIFFREGDDFDAAVKKLLTAIHTDYEWVQTHREIQVKALEWDRHNHENSFLLRGKELQDAELQLATNTSKEPYPTDLQRDYVFNSRKSADRQRRIVTSVSIAGVIALAALAVFGFIKAGQATTNAEASNHNAATAQANLVVAQTAQADAQIANTAVVSANATTESNLILTQNELRKARNQALSAQSEQISNEAPSASILLALEAIKLNQDANEPTSHASYQALRDALFNTQGNPMEGNSEVILAMKYSKDGHWFATGGKDGLVRVWDTKQSAVRGLPMFTLNCEQGEVQYLFLSDNGSRLVTMGSDKKVCAWNMTAFDPVQTVVKVTADLPTVDDFAASPDGRWAAAGNVEANQVVIWDLENNTAFDPIKISDKPALGSLHLVFNPEESLLLVSNDTTIQFWFIEPTGPVRNSGGGFVTIDGGDGLNPNTRIHVLQVQFTSDGKRIIGFGPSNWYAPSHNDNYIFFIFDTATFLKNPKILRSLDFATIQAMNISPDGRWLAGANSNTIWLLDLRSLSHNPLPLEGHQAVINTLVFSNDGHWLASATVEQGDGNIRLWDLSANNPAESSLIIPASLENNLLAFDSQSNWLALRSEDQLVRFFNLATQKFSIDPLDFSDTSAIQPSEIQHYSEFGNWYDIAVNPVMNWLFPHHLEDQFVEQDFYLLSRTFKLPPSILTKLGPDANIYGYRPDGKHLIYGKCNLNEFPCEIFEIDVSQGSLAIAKSLFTVKDKYVIKARLTSDNHWMILDTYSASEWGSYLVNLEEAPPRLKSENFVSGYDLGIAGDRWLITSDDTGMAYLDLNASNPISTKKFLPNIYPLAISPDGHWLVNEVSSDSTLGLLDLNQLEKGTPINILLSLPVPYYRSSVNFSEDSRWLMSVQCLEFSCEQDIPFLIWDLSKANPQSTAFKISLQGLPYPNNSDQPIKPFVMSLDQQWLGLLDAAGNATLVELSGNAAVIKEFQNEPSIGGYVEIVFSPDSRWFATIGKLGNVTLHDLSNAGSEPLIPNRLLNAVASLAFNSDKDNIMLAGGTTNGQVLLWNLNDLTNDENTPPIVLHGGVRTYDEIAFTPDDSWIVAYGPEETLKAWRAKFEEVMEFACESAGRNLSPSEWTKYGFTDGYRKTCEQWSLPSEAIPTALTP